MNCVRLITAVLLSLVSPLFSGTPAPSTGYAGAADVKYAAAAVQSNADQDSKVASAAQHGSYTRLVDDLRNYEEYAGKQATASSSDQDETHNLKAARHPIIEIISNIATQYRAHDPLFVFDRAHQQLRECPEYEAEVAKQLVTSAYYHACTDAGAGLSFLEKLLLQEWDLFHNPPKPAAVDHRFTHHLWQPTPPPITIFSPIEQIYYENYKKIKPEVRAKVHELYRKKIEALKNQPELPKELWSIIIEYGGAPSWGCSVDEAYTMYHQLHPQAAEPSVSLSGYGINSAHSDNLRGKKFYCTDLSCNLIAELPANAITWTSARLDLRDNPLQQVAPGAFANQPKLEELSLNPVIKLQKGTFQGLTYLITLRL
jgi:hypothetical protein